MSKSCNTTTYINYSLLTIALYHPLPEKFLADSALFPQLIGPTCPNDGVSTHGSSSGNASD